MVLICDELNILYLDNSRRLLL